MKKIFYVSAITVFSFMLTNSAYATDTVKQTNAGNKISLTDPTGLSGATLDVDQSPGVASAVATTANAFSLISLNTVAVPDKRVQYGISSRYSGYYQKPDTTTPAVTPAAPAADGTTFATAAGVAANSWVGMGSANTVATPK